MVHIQKERRELQPFLSPAPQVRLTNAFRQPFKNSVATARTCYSSRGIVTGDQLGENYESLAKSIYRAGHHTTLQHASFQFTLDHVSRQFLWSFLHSHPYYNSEQASQRYVAVKPDRVAVPSLEGRALSVYQETVSRQVEDYERLVELLRPRVLSEYQKRFPARKAENKATQSAARKKAQEIARYVLPVATFACLYHTVNGLTLLRYHRLCEYFDAPSEQRLVVELMVRELLRHDPNYQSILEEPLPLEQTPEFIFFKEHSATGNSRVREFLQEFDSSLGSHCSKMVSSQPEQEKMLADAVREVLGCPRSDLDDDEAIALALDPGRNPMLGQSLNLTAHSKISRALSHVSYTFRKKLSHAADSQDQRHRTTPASRPVLAAHISDEPDYILPLLIQEEPEALKVFQESIEKTWEAFTRLKQLGSSFEFASYVLPNALPIRFTQSADLLNLRHKLAMRLCYNAQEEIWRASIEEARQIQEVHPRIGQYLLPPCGIRRLAKTTPFCPEGDRFCGERVWLSSLENYKRVI
jgi:thymidylate synthase ThyX